MPTADHEVTEVLSPEAIEARLSLLGAVQVEGGREGAVERVYTEAIAEAERDERDYRYFRPLSEAADEYEHFAKTSDRRIYTGIPAFDEAMRGIAPREMCLVVGFAHSGKTLFTTEVLLTNRERRVIFFTPDETRTLVLVKLACLIHGISAAVLEQRIADDDEEAIRMVRETASKHFPNLAVFDDSFTIREMDQAIAEVEQHWGGPAELLVYDYVDLLQGSGEDVPSKVNNLKAWGKRHDVPFILLHQSSRSSGSDGKEVTISSGGYGGEQQATFLIGVRRKKSECLARIRDLTERIKASSKDTSVLEVQLDSARYDLARHEHTVTFNLVKNKRPPSQLVEDTDYTLDAKTGRITPIGHGMGLPNPGYLSAAARARATAPPRTTWQDQVLTAGDEEPF